MSAGEPIFSPEPGKTPSYYSNEKLPAWFKLAAIDPVPEALFVETFGELPTGEHTLFPISRDQLPVRAAPASTRLNTSTVLHLSDIHFGVDYAFPMLAVPRERPLLDIIEEDLRDAPPGLIIVSGDITSRADANVLQDEGLTFLRALSERLRVPPECFVVVPGNHDIPLKKFRPIDYSHETSFRLFAKEFYGRDASYPELRSFTLPTGLQIEVLAINSVRLRHEKEKNFGYVEWRLYDRMLSGIPHNPEVFRIAVLHHHLVPASLEESVDPDWPEASLSATLDAGAVIQGLQRYGFSMVLSGHQHVPAASTISRANFENGPVDLDAVNALTVLAAGSAGSSRLSDELRDNSFTTIRFGNGQFEAVARRYNKGLAPSTYFSIRGNAAGR